MYLTKEEQEEVQREQATDGSGNEKEKLLQRMNDLLEKRVAELEREIKRNDPDLAKEIGIE
jgi:hypothetical protein